MKNKYQVIMPLALPFLLAVSVAMMIKTRTEQRQQYQSYLQAARQYIQNGVYADAAASYEAAIDLQPSVDVWLELGQMYENLSDYENAEDVYEQLLSRYPKDVRTYEFGVRTQLEQGNIRKAYQVLDACTARKLTSQSITEQMEPYRYAFDTMGTYTAVGGFNTRSGLAAVCYGDTWGYIDLSGERVIDNYYQQVSSFTEMGAVVDTEGEAYYIDKNGNKKITASYYLEKDTEFEKITEFGIWSDGLVSAYNGEIWNFYDAETCEKKFGGYKKATAVMNGFGAVSVDGSTWALIDANGQQITDFSYLGFLSNDQGEICRGETVIAQRSDGYCLLNTSGQPISQTVYQDAKAFADDRPAAVKKDGRWIFVDASGNEFDLGDFEDAESFSAGAAAVRKNGLWGYINESGEWLIEPQFYGAKAFNGNGVAFVKNEEEQWQLLLLTRLNHD